MKKTVCITGASGFVGKEILAVLHQSYRVHVLSREPREIVGATVFSGDIYNETLLRDFLKGADYLVHAAAVTNPQDPDLTCVNVDLTRSLVDAAIQSKIKMIVYISSENVTYALQDPYSQSKKAAEEIVSLHPHSLILRPSIVFGKGDRRYVMQFAQLIKKLPLIPVFHQRQSTIQPIHVTDIAQLVFRGIERGISGTFTLVGTSPLSFKELGTMIARILSKKRAFVEVPPVCMGLFIRVARFFGSRYASMLSNALVIRNADISAIETNFSYTFPSFESRLRESLLS